MKYDPKKWDPNVYGRRVGYYPTSEVFKNLDRSEHVLDRPSDAEYERRHKAIRKFMENKGLDCLLLQSIGPGSWVNVRWVTNVLPLSSSNTYLVIPAKGEMTLFTGFQWVVDPVRRAQTVIEDVRGGYPIRHFGSMTVERIKELGYTKGKIGIVSLRSDVAPDSIPGSDLKLFAEELPQAQFEFVTNDWWKQLRLIKSNEEIEFMEKAAAVGDRMIEALVENARPGITEADLFGVMYGTLFKYGGEPVLVMLDSTNTFHSTSAFHRPRPKNRVLQHGDIIHQEIWLAYSDGSQAGIGYPIALGQPSKEYLEMTGLMLRVYNDVIDQLRPGKTTKDLQKAAAPLLEAGYSSDCPACWGVPYRNCGEYPCAMVFDDPAGHLPEPFVFAPGMTIHVRIYIKTIDFTKGVEIGEMWVITEDEPRCLNKYPRQLTIV